MFNKTLLGLTVGALMFTAGSAVAAEYKIDKEGQHAFIEFRIKHLGYSWLYGSFNDFDGFLLLMKRIPQLIK
ncbi:protein yceI precursor [Yersinia enterocolitica subsp. palearctica Y11]|uniref:Protein yceI n=1 Tax=Yersinia enterocolitica subsp. palearctica serotype O:3 (strain DSM 13030 / CIP 106945 / Y11) TaxID=930944 RepID=A0A0H3NSS9_YERE1|nr:protein yceI precursor [Yersinia enterocolitica subsp. palearctica Y11]